MNIFIDTSVVYTDPFWKRNFASEILNSAKDEKLTIYISDVVIRELRVNLKKQLNKEITSLKNSYLSIRKITLEENKSELPKLEDYLKEFDEFNTKLFENKNIIELKYSSEDFEEILERAIQRKKPFTDNRSELKDAVIWMTYSKFAKDNGLDNCYLLTNNVKDFCDNNDKNKLHSELAKDYDKFKVNLTLEEFYRQNKDTIEDPNYQFTEWLLKQNLDSNSVVEMLFENVTDNVANEIDRKVENIDPSSFSDENFYIPLGGYTEVESYDWGGISDLQTEIVDDYAIISGVLDVSTDINIYGYNSVRDKGDEKFPYLGDKNLSWEVLFNFVFDKENGMTDFEITDVILN